VHNRSYLLQRIDLRIKESADMATMCKTL
jgi:hypothetical protein